MYPDWQFLYWFRSVFWKKNDFVYRDKTGQEVRPGSTSRTMLWLLTFTALAGGAFIGPQWFVNELPRRLTEFDPRAFVGSLTT
jgi:hypothetical protein